MTTFRSVQRQRNAIRDGLKPNMIAAICYDRNYIYSGASIIQTSIIQTVDYPNKLQDAGHQPKKNNCTERGTET